MKNILSTSMPTLLGLSVILLGIIGGVFLILSQNQTLISKASPDQMPKNITLTNIEGESISISWQTSTPTPGFVTFGISSPDEKTALDDRDSTPTPTSQGQAPLTARVTHHVTLKNLAPSTSYKLKIFSGKNPYQEIINFTTASLKNEQNGFKPVIGSVLNGDNPVTEGIVYLNISKATTSSAITREFGNFIIPISTLRSDDLKDILTPQEDMIIKLTVISDQGEGTALARINDSDIPLVLRIGQNLDLTKVSQSPTPTIFELQIYDLDNNKSINAADHSIVLQNFGKNPKEKKADINKDGVVDQKDLDLISQKLNQPIL